MAIAANDCETMSEIREGIDHLDEQLLDLFAERQRYIDRAAIIKIDEGIPVRVPERIECILSRLKTLCPERNLDPALFCTLWSQLMEHAIAREAAIQKQVAEEKVASGQV